VKIMKPIASSEIPHGQEWLYEVKYDGFRCVLHWDKQGNITLTSRNKQDLTNIFPEIVAACRENHAVLTSLLPVTLDGELVVLNNDSQANFALIQKRGRLKNKESIEKASKLRPASFLAFELLELAGTLQMEKSYVNRKEQLQHVFKLLQDQERIKQIQAYEDPNELRKIVFNSKGEGIIAKRKNSSYLEGKKHHDWFKIKNWRTIQVFLTEYNPENDYFTANVFQGDRIIEIGKCKHGLDEETAHTLQQVFLTNGEKNGAIYQLPPAVCASIHTLDLFKDELREPEFAALLPETSPSECTADNLMLDMTMFPANVDLSNTDKIFWPDKSLRKGDMLIFMREIAPYMLPFLRDRAVTLIRCPDGVRQEHFFQKHLPDYAPEFIEDREDRKIISDTLEALIWLANHGAVEYHIPFQLADTPAPIEIVFDLDPPDREYFSLAIQAAQLIKSLLDDLDLISLVKTSGNKGLQIHIPIPSGSMTYDDTAIFTEAIAATVENAYPNSFTTERFKNKRHGRLYIDYVQHGKDKTLIAPYSPRKTNDATVATPLFWEEVKEDLNPAQFTIENVVERVQTLGCPFHRYFEIGQEQKMDKVLGLVKE